MLVDLLTQFIEDVCKTLTDPRIYLLTPPPGRALTGN
jgi:hypothetical protein